MAGNDINKRFADQGSIRRAERWAIYMALVFVAAFFLFGMLTGGEEVLDALTKITWLQFAGLLGLSLLNYLGRTIRWHMFSRKLDIHVSFGLTTIYYIAGFAMTATPAKAGEALRMWFLRKAHGVRYARSMSMMVADRISDMSAILILMAACVAVFGDYWLITAIAVTGNIGITIAFLMPQLSINIINMMYGRVKRWPRLFAQLRHMMRQAGRLASVPVYGGALLIAIGGWFAEAYAFHWVLQILGATEVSLGAAVFIFAFAMVAGTIAMLPGGLGGTEAVMIGLLSLLDVPIEISVAATLVIRATTLWFAVLLGFGALPVALRRVRGLAQDRGEQTSGEQG